MNTRRAALRAMLAASAIVAFATSASAMGMGGGGMVGGMGVGMAGAGAPGALGAAAAASVATYSSANGSPNGAHVPVGALDGPSGMSATSGHNPFGHAGASSAWTSLPGIDPDVPGMTVPSTH